MKSELPVLVRDLYDIIDNDRYAWMVCWGPARTGKSTLCLLLAYWVYKDWDKVLDCIVFNLNQLLYKLEQGVPERWPTRNGLHMRIPLLIWDDFACHAGKAKTQHERSWDIFKGAFDSLGVKIGVLIANMVTPSSPTLQLTEKYTHELFVHSRGRCKYDRVKHQQDYYNFRTRQNKEWLCEFEFEEVPRDVFKQYDELRCSLADEVLVSIKDVMATTEVESIIKRMKPIDYNLLTFLEERGPSYNDMVYETLGDESRDAIVRLKARGLIVPRRIATSRRYRYHITDLGTSVLKEAEKQKEESVTSVKAVTPVTK